MSNTQQTGNVANMAERNREILAMPNVRVFYQKRGRAKFISHLDVTRCMQRALKRAEIPVWYTQGFNPHMHLSFALPLPLGYESECECMDFRLAAAMPLEEVEARLRRALPEDMPVIRAALQQAKPQEIAAAEYRLSFPCAEPDEFAQAFDRFCGREELVVMKRTKKGEKPVDLKPEFTLLERRCEPGRAVYRMRFTAGEKNVNPTLLTDLFFREEPQRDHGVQVLRQKLLLADGREFA